MCQQKQPIWPRVEGDILIYRLKIQLILTAIQPMIIDVDHQSVNNENPGLK
jgi:hypothetical protein